MCNGHTRDTCANDSFTGAGYRGRLCQWNTVDSLLARPIIKFCFFFFILWRVVEMVP